GAVGGCTFLDDRGAVTIAITIFRGLTDRNAGADRADMNADFIRERRGRDGCDHGSGKKILLHFMLLSGGGEGMRDCDILFRGNAGAMAVLHVPGTARSRHVSRYNARMKQADSSLIHTRRSLLKSTLGAATLLAVPTRVLA